MSSPLPPILHPVCFCKATRHWNGLMLSFSYQVWDIPPVGPLLVSSVPATLASGGACLYLWPPTL